MGFFRSVRRVVSSVVRTVTNNVPTILTAAALGYVFPPAGFSALAGAAIGAGGAIALGTVADLTAPKPPRIEEAAPPPLAVAPPPGNANPPPPPGQTSTTSPYSQPPEGWGDMMTENMPPGVPPYVIAQGGRAEPVVIEARRLARKRASRTGAGRGSTILTSSLGVTGQAPGTPRTLLGGAASAAASL